ncbi:MAG TPA: hypothetical protein VGO57_03275 [Verrucomicrobiae bacterium]|jgi:hypothetical protein
MKRQKNIANTRFAACTAGARLLVFRRDVTRRAAGGSCSTDFQFSTGGYFRSDFIPLTDKSNLTTVKFFEGKFRGTTIKKQKNSTSIERTHCAKTHE